MMTNESTWDETAAHAFKLVVQNFKTTDGEEDLELARRATLALFLGLKWEWIKAMYEREDAEAVIEAVRLRLH